mgnify:CR=1 FL=1
MANDAQFTTSKRKYTTCLGVVEYDFGSAHYKSAVIAEFEETTVIKRGLTQIEVDTPSLTMATYDFWYGGMVSGITHVYFDYEQSRVASECHRVSEAGFFEKTTVTTVCTNVYAQ